MIVKELFCAALRNAAQDRYNDLLKVHAPAIMLEAQLRIIKNYSTEFIFPGEKRGFIAPYLTALADEIYSHKNPKNSFKDYYVRTTDGTVVKMYRDVRYNNICFGIRTTIPNGALKLTLIKLK